MKNLSYVDHYYRWLVEFLNLITPMIDEVLSLTKSEAIGRKLKERSFYFNWNQNQNHSQLFLYGDFVHFMFFKKDVSYLKEKINLSV